MDAWTRFDECRAARLGSQTTLCEQERWFYAELGHQRQPRCDRCATVPQGAFRRSAYGQGERQELATKTARFGEALTA